MEDKNIVIIGGGFAGINLAMDLANVKGLNVTLVDQNNYNHFTPLLYQLAAGFLDVSSISIPLRTLFKGKKNLHFRLGELQKVIPQERKVVLPARTISYDYLVIATGTKPDFFGMKNIQRNALPMKSIDDAVRLRNFLLSETEKYIQSDNEEEKRKMRNIVIAGAGPSGVELAGILSEVRNRILEDIYPELDEDRMNIYLVDAASSVLPPMAEKSQKYARKCLEDMGVQVQLEKMVSDYKEDKVEFKDGSYIETKTLIWAAGVTGFRLDGFPDNCYQKGNRLQVNEYNEVVGTENIYSIGDSCIMSSDPNFPNGHPQLAAVAKQQGEAMAKNFIALVKGEKQLPFKYKDKGTMAIIGRNRAVADLTIAEKTITGWIAWVAWITVHLFLLLSYRNQVRTMWNWANSFFSDGHSQGILVGQLPKRSLPENKMNQNTESQLFNIEDKNSTSSATP
jgi:NADH dehydrogenase